MSSILRASLESRAIRPASLRFSGLSRFKTPMRLALLAFAAALCALAGGCGKGEESAQSPGAGASGGANDPAGAAGAVTSASGGLGSALPLPSGPPPVVGLVMKSLANEFFKTMEEGALAHAAANPGLYELVAAGIKDELDVAAQVSLVEDMIARKVAALVIAPADSLALVPVLRRAREAGVVVVNIDNRLDAGAMQIEGLRAPFVGPDNREGARLAGEFLSLRLTRGDKVAILEGVPTAFNAQQRKLGFEDACRDAGLEIVSSLPADWEMNKALLVAGGMLEANPEIRALLCSNDSMALGAHAATRAAGRADVLIVGFDAIEAVRELIAGGQILCSVDQHGDRLAVYGIEFALEALRGGSPEDRGTPVDLVTRDTLGEASRVSP